jgi:hypothetical protein
VLGSAVSKVKETHSAAFRQAAAQACTLLLLPAGETMADPFAIRWYWNPGSNDARAADDCCIGAAALIVLHGRTAIGRKSILHNAME